MHERSSEILSLRDVFGELPCLSEYLRHMHLRFMDIICAEFHLLEHFLCRRMEWLVFDTNSRCLRDATKKAHNLPAACVVKQ